MGEETAISFISFSITPKVSKIADTKRDGNAKNMIRSLGRILKTDELDEVFVSPVLSGFSTQLPVQE